MTSNAKKPLLNPQKAEAALLPQEAPPEAVEAPSTPRSLDEVAISSELAHLFFEARSLLSLIKNDMEVPANQKAQVMNSVLSILERITKTQTDLYNAERIRVIEQTLLRVMREQPQEIKEAFMSTYEAALAS